MAEITELPADGHKLADYLKEQERAEFSTNNGSSDPGDYARRQIAKTLAERDNPPRDSSKVENPLNSLRKSYRDMKSWVGRAACDLNTAVYFHAPSHAELKDDKAEREARAKSTCGECAVRASCLDYALRTKQKHGIWGGLDEKEREQLLARRPND